MVSNWCPSSALSTMTATPVSRSADLAGRTLLRPHFWLSIACTVAFLYQVHHVAAAEDVTLDEIRSILVPEQEQVKKTEKEKRQHQQRKGDSGRKRKADDSAAKSRGQAEEERFEAAEEEAAAEPSKWAGGHGKDGSPSELTARGEGSLLAGIAARGAQLVRGRASLDWAQCWHCCCAMHAGSLPLLSSQLRSIHERRPQTSPAIHCPWRRRRWRGPRCAHVQWLLAACSGCLPSRRSCLWWTSTRQEEQGADR